ncbi:Quinone oxidoreductase [Collimonas fungivorans Ter331]|uniref:Quinone oxidoreductase n=1 Tax=Collimonas fungivorans (strain Ter331) TaxID=1005048 RepID=G0A8Y2_COLFT|nr:Quinone oxidoreductase [Collimonas fungivorans Ter331]
MRAINAARRPLSGAAHRLCTAQGKGKGKDVILDIAAGDYIQRELNCLADDGRLVFIAMLGGAKAHIHFAQVLLHRLTIAGSPLRPRPVAVQGHHPA